MTNDPVVSEVRRVREQLAERCGYNIHNIFAEARRRARDIYPSHPIVEDVHGIAGGSVVVKEEPGMTNE